MIGMQVTPDSRPPISAIVPTYHALRYLPACLSALQAQLLPHDEIILVDNASRDNAGAWVRRYAPDVQVISLPHNLGFAGGTNAGIAQARGALLLLINDDALAEPGCVDALWQALRTTPDAGAAAGVLTFSRHPHVAASAGITFRRDGVATDTQIGTLCTDLPQQPVRIFGASGGLALLRRTLIDDIGAFAPEFFNYLEDADLAWRAQLRGWGCVLAPDARARHVYSATGTHGSAFKQQLLARNRLRVIIRCLPGPLLRDSLPAILTYDILAIIYATLHRTPAIIQGRSAALRELPSLLRQRRQIQARRSTPVGELAAWVTAAPHPLAELRARRKLARILAS